MSQLRILKHTKVGVVATALVLLFSTGLTIGYVSLAMMQESNIELLSTSVDGGGGEMMGGGLLMDFALADSQPIGETSSTGYTLDSGIVPIIAQNAVSTTATPTPVPALTRWGLITMAGLLALAVAWRLRRSIGGWWSH